MLSRKRSYGPVFVRQRTGDVRMPISSRYQKRCLGIPFPENSEQLQSINPSCSADALDRISRDEQTTDDVKLSTLTSTKDLDQGLRIIAANKNLSVSPCSEKHRRGVGSLLGTCTKLFFMDEGPELVFGHEYWLLSLDQVPHLLLKQFADSLEEHMERRTTSTVCSRAVNRAFASSQEPSITVRDYLKLLSCEAYCDATVFVVASIYLNRAMLEGLILSKLTVHRIVLIAVSTAAKFVDDDVITDKMFAKSGGVSLHEFRKLEHKFVATVLKWKLFVTSEEFVKAAELMKPVVSTCKNGYTHS